MLTDLYKRHEVSKIYSEGLHAGRFVFLILFHFSRTVFPGFFASCSGVIACRTLLVVVVVVVVLEVTN